jgi:hypothetical protein
MSTISIGIEPSCRILSDFSIRILAGETEEERMREHRGL